MAEALVKALRDGGAARFLVCRHANAAPLDPSADPAQPHGWKRADQQRALTPVGRAQATAAGEWLKELLPLHCTLTSPARRATETSAAMLSACGQSADLRTVETLHPWKLAGTPAEACEEMFARKGYGPLRGFHDDQDGKGKGFFEAYAEQVCAELATAVPAKGATPGRDAIAWGHAVFLNQVAWSVARAAGGSGDEVLDVDLKEAEALAVDIATGAVTVMNLRPIGPEQVTARLKDVFDKLSASTGGVITWEDLQKRCGEQAQELLDMADTNKDKKIDADEFVAFGQLAFKSEDVTMDKVTLQHIQQLAALFGATI